MTAQPPYPRPQAKTTRTATVREALLVLLDSVDYTSGACGPTEMVGAVLPGSVIRLAREALAAEVSR